MPPLGPERADCYADRVLPCQRRMCQMHLAGSVHACQQFGVVRGKRRFIAGERRRNVTQADQREWCWCQSLELRLDVHP